MRKFSFMWKKIEIYSIKKTSFGQKRPCVLHDFVPRSFLCNPGGGEYLFPTLSVDFPDPIRHFTFSPVIGIIRMLFCPFFSFLYFLVFSCQLSPQRTGLYVVLQSMLRGSNNHSASTDIYTFKGFCRVC